MDTQTKPSSATANITEDRPCEETVPSSGTLLSTSPISPPRPLRPRTPNTDAVLDTRVDGGDTCVKEVNGVVGLASDRPQDHKGNVEVGGRHGAGDAPGISPEARQPPAPDADLERNGVPVHSGSVSLKLDSVRLATGAALGVEAGGCIRTQAGSRGVSAEGCGSEARDKSGGVALGGAAGGTPTWVVKPAANSNCGFGIHICCSLKVTAPAHPSSRLCRKWSSNQTHESLFGPDKTFTR